MINFLIAAIILPFSSLALAQERNVLVTSEQLGDIRNEEVITNYLKQYNGSELRRKCHSSNGSLLNVEHLVNREPRHSKILVQVESAGLCRPDEHAKNLILETCGLLGDFSNRISDCKSINGTNATIEGNGFKWSLLANTPSAELIWLDHLTGMLWTSPLEGTYMTGVGFNPCKDVGIRYALEGVSLRMPALSHFETAWHHEAQRILPFARGVYWTSTFQGDIQAYAFNGSSGQGRLAPVDREFHVRCVTSIK